MIMPWGCPAEWFRAHVCTHHPYTNTDLDPDFINDDPLVRHHPDSPFAWIHQLMILFIVLYGPVLPFFYSLDGRAGGSSVRRAAKLSNTKEAWESRMYLVTTPCLFYAHYCYHGSVLLALLPVSAFGLLFLWITQLSQ